MGRIYLQPARVHYHNTSWLGGLALTPDVAHSPPCPDWCGPACAASSAIVLVTHPGREELLLHSSHPLFSAHWALDHAGWGPVEEKKKDRKKENSAACCLSLHIRRRITGVDESRVETLRCSTSITFDFFLSREKKNHPKIPPKLWSKN